MRWKLPTAATLVVIVVLAVGGALVGLVIHGTAGAGVGAGLATLAGVATSYMPLFRDRAERRRAELAQAPEKRSAANAGLKAAAEPALAEPVSGPSLLLRPELAVVEFAGRLAELGELRAWCALDDPRSVRVLVGAGGVGKTRLALKIAAEWQASGKTAVKVDAGKESEALAKARGVTSGPVLLVVDYAETRAGLGELLRAVLDDPGLVRVLLVARSLGEWWDRIAEESAPAIAQLLSGAEPTRLTAPIQDIPDHDLAASAVPYFARKLGVAVPECVVFDLPTRRVPVLVLHTSALVAVLRSITGPPGTLRVAVTDGVLGELLEHEARYWRRTAKSCELTADGRVLKAVIAAAILLGAADLEEAAALAGRVPDLAGTAPGDLRSWGRWLLQLYPSDATGRMGSIQPDLLAEHHIMTQLTGDPGLAKAILTSLTVDQADQALTVLGRAWTLHDGAGPAIEAALRADLARMAIPAANVAVQTSPRIGDLLADALADAPIAFDDLVRIKEALPYPSVAIAAADLATTLRVRRELPPETDKETLAKWADTCGRLLSQVGRPADAVPPAQEAVTIRRELAAALPDRYRPDLAASLSNLGVCYAELGRPAEALPPAQEAVTIRRELAAALPDRYRPDLARSLRNLGVLYSVLGQPAEALPPAQEAVTTYRELAATQPDRYRPALARSLNNLGTCYSAMGRPAEALPPAQEAVTTYRELATAQPDRYHPDLAASLSNLGVCYAELGQPAEALPPAQEAVTIRRELAAALPDRYRPDLSRSLSNLGVLYSALGRPADALPPAQEAVATDRELATALPDRCRPDLARSLYNLGTCYSALGRPADALPPAQEAVATYRELATALPDRYRPDLATSLSNLGAVLAALGRYDEAATARNEADELGSAR